MKVGWSLSDLLAVGPSYRGQRALLFNMDSFASLSGLLAEIECTETHCLVQLLRGFAQGGALLYYWLYATNMPDS